MLVADQSVVLEGEGAFLPLQFSGEHFVAIVFNLSLDVLAATRQLLQLSFDRLFRPLNFRTAVGFQSLNLSVQFRLLSLFYLRQIFVHLLRLSARRRALFLNVGLLVRDSLAALLSQLLLGALLSRTLLHRAGPTTGECLVLSMF